MHCLPIRDGFIWHASIAVEQTNLVANLRAPNHYWAENWAGYWMTVQIERDKNASSSSGLLRRGYVGGDGGVDEGGANGNVILWWLLCDAHLFNGFNFQFPNCQTCCLPDCQPLTRTRESGQKRDGKRENLPQSLHLPNIQMYRSAMTTCLHTHTHIQYLYVFTVQ